MARDAGMRYMILTSKHGTGFCLWPSKRTDYHVGNGPVKTDVVEAFVAACQKYGIKPGLYYGGPTGLPGGSRAGGTFDKGEWPSYTTRAQQEYRLAQVEELLTQWPLESGSMGRRAWARRPATVRLLRQPGSRYGDRHEWGWEDDGRRLYEAAPLLAARPDLHRVAAPPIWGTDPWRTMPVNRDGELVEQPLDYYISGSEHHVERAAITPGSGARTQPQSDMELLGMRDLTKARNANLLLNCARRPRTDPRRAGSTTMRLRVICSSWAL